MSILKRKEMDMTNGSIFKKLIAFAIPLVIANLLQTAFNLADTLILGMFAENGNDCVGAVSTTAALTNLCIAMFIGLSAGSNVMVARNIGAKNQEGIKRTIGLSVFLSVYAGIVLVIIGVFCSKYFLQWTGVSQVHFDLANRYLTIYLCGMPFIMLYNFCASILRASGDTFRPMIYITIGGVLNVILNIILVVFTPLDVEGVAIATVASNAFAGIACFITLIKSKTDTRFEWKYFRIFKQELVQLLRIGVPSGIQICVLSFSNVLVTSAMNELGILYGPHIISAYGYSVQIDNIIYVMLDSIALSAQVFVSQNMGAKQIGRIRKALFVSVGMVSVVGLFLSSLLLVLIKPIVFAISGDQLVAAASFTRMWVTMFAFLCGIMSTFSLSLRGLGKSFVSMMVVISCNLVLWVLWLSFVFPLNKTEAMVYIFYPITWTITITVLGIIFFTTLKNLQQKFLKEEQTNLNQQ